MSIGTLADIILKVRRLTGSSNDLSLTDAMIIDYINSFYLYDFPAEFRSLKLRDTYTFNTQRGIACYAFDQEQWSTIQAPCFCAKRPLALFQDPSTFYSANFNWQFFNTLTQGDGSTDAGGAGYTGTTQSHPIIRSTNNNPMVTTQLTSSQAFTNDFTAQSSLPTFTPAIPSRSQNILITANVGFGTTLNVTDDGGINTNKLTGNATGNLIGDCTAGTINYETGVVSGLIFTQAIPEGANIVINYNPTTTLTVPVALMFWQNTFTLRPVPDTGYTVEMVGYRLPSQVLLGSKDPTNPNTAGTPELLEWWETLAFGASKKIYEDRLDPDGASLMEASLTKQYALNETRTYAQIGTQQMNTIFRGQLNTGYVNNNVWAWGTGSQ